MWRTRKPKLSMNPTGDQLEVDGQKSYTSPSSPRQQGRARTGHACEPCRKRRAKCNGVQPRCGRCEEINSPCFYSESKAQRHHKEKVLSSKAGMYEALLRSMIPDQDAEGQRRIRAILADDRNLEEESSSRNALNPLRDEVAAKGDAGSPKQQGTNAEMSQSEGYLGESSLARWLSDIGEKINRDPNFAFKDRNAPETNPTELEGILVEAASYHVSEFEDELVADVGASFDIKYIPPRWQADQYLQEYLQTIQPLFQVVEVKQFLLEYDIFFSTGVPAEEGVLWQAMLNLVFALGSLRTRYATSQSNRAEDVEYFLRARVLSLEPLNLLQIPSRAHVQLTAMFAIYLTASNRINRAWLMIGTSIRYAQTLGFHLANIDDHISPFEKELRKRVWHSMSTLEHLLGFLTGRPLAINEPTISVGLPGSIKEAMQLDSRSRSSERTLDYLYDDDEELLETFRRGILLDRILSESLQCLYTAETVRNSWSHIQHKMATLNIKLSTWKAYLPERYGLKNLESGVNPQQRVDAMYLALRFLSVSILINRLSLCYRHNREDNIMPDQSRRSRETDMDNARRAVFCAQRLIQLLSRVTLFEIYTITPWWCLLHFLVQACALLIMELVDASVHIPGSDEDILTDAQIGIDILDKMAGGNPAARKASDSPKVT
ncbi:putative c6 transcription factor [Phaeomoniella chlamydospora]|uniref:Putative c6 transcription factor n=1 Tax=Phaeomoniella chlamydospora TaxID=158046 RepID=A0A0G2FY13_PHACM|nr:putative c6 transcription factor [Phaeomoniella chlamydospora]